MGHSVIVVWLSTWVGSVRAGRVVEYEDRCEVGADGGEVLGVRPEVQRAVLAVVSEEEEKVS